MLAPSISRGVFIFFTLTYNIYTYMIRNANLAIYYTKSLLRSHRTLNVFVRCPLDIVQIRTFENIPLLLTLSIPFYIETYYERLEVLLLFVLQIKIIRTICRINNRGEKFIIIRVNFPVFTKLTHEHIGFYLLNNTRYFISELILFMLQRVIDENKLG